MGMHPIGPFNTTVLLFIGSEKVVHLLPFVLILLQEAQAPLAVRKLQTSARGPVHRQPPQMTPNRHDRCGTKRSVLVAIQCSLLDVANLGKPPGLATLLFFVFPCTTAILLQRCLFIRELSGA